MGTAMSAQHKELADGKWAELSLFEQLSNIGSEVSRAFNWKNKGKEKLHLNAVVRALELLDLSLDSAKSFPRIRELARLRECLVDYFFGSNQFASSETLFRSYFDHFTFVLRKYT